MKPSFYSHNVSSGLRLQLHLPDHKNFPVDLANPFLPIGYERPGCFYLKQTLRLPRPCWILPERAVGLVKPLIFAALLGAHLEEISILANWIVLLNGISFECMHVWMPVVAVAPGGFNGCTNGCLKTGDYLHKWLMLLPPGIAADEKKENAKRMGRAANQPLNQIEIAS